MPEIIALRLDSRTEGSDGQVAINLAGLDWVGLE